MSEKTIRRLTARWQAETAPESKVAAQEGIRNWDQRVLREGRVLFLGAGAIGNEVEKNMALTGLGYAMICDMDTVDRSNLSRTVLFGEEALGKLKAVEAARSYRKMNVYDGARVDCFVGNVCTELGMGVFNHVDVVAGCLDNEQARFEANRRCALLNKPFVDGGIFEMAGNVTVARSGRDAPCWACQLPPRAVLEATEMRRNSCAKATVEAWKTGHAPTAQVTSAIISGMESMEIVKCLHALKGGEMSCDFGRTYVFDGLHNSFTNIKIRRRPDCDFHTPYDRVEETEITGEWTLRRTLEYVGDRYGAGYTLNLEPDAFFRPAGYVTKARCLHCGKPIDVNCARNRMRIDRLFCPDCPRIETGSAELWEGTVYRFSLCPEQETLMELTLSDLGIPPFHILEFVRGEDEEDRVVLEMTGDMKRVMPNLAE